MRARIDNGTWMTSEKLFHLIEQGNTSLMILLLHFQKFERIRMDFHKHQDKVDDIHGNITDQISRLETNLDHAVRTFFDAKNEQQ